jgi:hypothetical protein
MHDSSAVLHGGHWKQKKKKLGKKEKFAAAISLLCFVTYHFPFRG